MTIESTPAFFQPSKPVASSRLGSGGCDGSPGCGAIEDPCCSQYGWTWNPYSLCTPSAGTTGLNSGTPP